MALENHSLTLILLVAAGTVILYPSLSLGVLLALGAIAVSPWARQLSTMPKTLKGQAVRELIDVLKPGLAGALPGALAASLSSEATSKAMVKLATTFLDELRTDKCFHDAVSRIVLETIVKNTEMKSFVVDLLHEAANTGMEESRMREAWMDVIKLAVIDALRDKEFMSVITGTIKASLKDSDLFTSAAKGAVGALNPFRNKSPEPQ